ncbi:MAG: universal stress protein [Cyclobacteriaceae bacterium]|nr:universal stress protein [Cyclobacteriaceae bacterium]
MKRILCPTDFSDIAHNAIAFAAKLAQRTAAELVLLNVQSVFDLTPVDMIRGKALTIEALARQLEAQSMEVSKAFKISCYSEIQPVASSLAKNIASAAREYDLLVMGTNGADDYYQAVFGSNAYHVVRQSSIPVLLVPLECSFTEIKQIIYAFDYLKDGKLPFRQLLPWVKNLQSEICVLDVMVESFSARAEDERIMMQEQLKALYEDEVALRFDTIRSADVIESINRYMLKTNADMLALCTHHHGLLQLFHKSVIRAISSMARYPVFVFHE